jgi:hypothetical protein
MVEVGVLFELPGLQTTGDPELVFGTIIITYS